MRKLKRLNNDFSKVLASKEYIWNQNSGSLAPKSGLLNTVLCSLWIVNNNNNIYSYCVPGTYSKHLHQTCLCGAFPIGKRDQREQEYASETTEYFRYNKKYVTC